MCGSAPSAPPAPPPDPDLERQKEEARQRAIEAKAREKNARTEEAIIRATGGYGMRSLISGSKGGEGFGSRSLIG